MSDNRQIVITSTRPNLRVTAWLGLDPPQVTAGYGGWDQVARPKRQSLTVWRGHAPYEMDVPILLDGWATGPNNGSQSVEARISAIERMGRPYQTLDEPPIIRIEGFVPHKDLAWVLQRITWGDAVRAENGQRVRQFLTLGLLKYIEADRVQQGNARVTAQNNTKGGTKKPHKVKQGETLQAIAAVELHDYRRWREIAKLNGFSDPKSIKVGQTLRIP